MNESIKKNPDVESSITTAIDQKAVQNNQESSRFDC
jgi:hypothetical protein